MPTHCRSAYCFPSLLPVLFWCDSFHFQPFKGLSSLLFWIYPVFLLDLLFPILIFLALSFCLLSSILHSCWFTHRLPPAQFSFPLSLCISSHPQATYLIACPFSSSTGSFHLLMSFVSKQQRSISYLLSYCCLSEPDCLEKKKRYWDCGLSFKIVPLYALIFFCILIISGHLEFSFVLWTWTFHFIWSVILENTFSTTFFTHFFAHNVWLESAYVHFCKYHHM